jgi:hypothetical protein
MEKDQEVEKKDVEQKPITHLAVPVENLQSLYGYLESLENNISFANANKIFSIIKTGSINMTYSKNDTDDKKIKEDKK